MRWKNGKLDVAEWKADHHTSAQLVTPLPLKDVPVPQVAQAVIHPDEDLARTGTGHLPEAHRSRSFPRRVETNIFHLASEGALLRRVRRIEHNVKQVAETIFGVRTRK